MLNASRSNFHAEDCSRVDAALKEIHFLHKDSNFLRTKLNLANFNNDALEQYERRESLRIHSVPEVAAGKDDPQKEFIESAKFVLSQLDEQSPFKEFKNRRVGPSDIQRCHRIGKPKVNTDDTPKKKENGSTKTRPIIVKLKDYKLRMAILLNKKKMEKQPAYKQQNRFITEDLTPFRNKLLWYTKNICKNVKGDKLFSDVHTRDGRIKAKKASDRNSKDWITISTPDDFHKHGHDIVLEKLNNDTLFKFSVLPLHDFNTSLKNVLDDFPVDEWCS